MDVRVKIFRGEGVNNKPFRYHTFTYSGEREDSVATLLNSLNERDELLDINGEVCERIFWECSCLVKKCGACAMRINGIPRLACSAFLYEYENEEIVLEPLSKFPHIKDLVSDRLFIFEALKKAELWLRSEAQMKDKTKEYRYLSAKCLMCGCCLEVCPNFNAQKNFSGAVLPVNMYRILNQQKRDEHFKAVKSNYVRDYYEDCARSLACHDICPAGLPVDDLTARSNAVAVWGRRKNI